MILIAIFMASRRMNVTSTAAIISAMPIFADERHYGGRSPINERLSRWRAEGSAFQIIRNSCHDGDAVSSFTNK